MKTHLVGIIPFLAGVLLVIAAVMRGEADLSLVLFIPVIHGGGLMLRLGILLIVASFLLWFFLPFGGSSTSGKGESGYGGVVFIGPIPIVFGSDTKMTRTMLIIGLVMAVLLLLFYLLFLL